MSGRLVCLVLLGWLLVSLPAHAADLYRNDNWSAMASDRNAHRVGDILTIIVYESAAAHDSANSNSKRSSRFGGQISADNTFNHSANLSLRSDSDDSGSTGRSGGMVAQISVTVDEVLTSGDLLVSGKQELNINGNKTNIRIKGRVRMADISNNAVLSSRLADAMIDYDGTGFVSSSARPGVLTRIFNWLGLS
ncbi:MAG TPA: flagellar basal body L-ring protein FlgH [Rhizomicrobium sp.]|nr:flagellar basal body L-ring protein FlgH [Rhizomicrobium sp.]